MDQTDLRLSLTEALATLAPNRRAVLILRYWEDHSVETVAQILGMSPGAVKSLTGRAIQELRGVIDPAISIGQS